MNDVNTFLIIGGILLVSAITLGSLTSRLGLPLLLLFLAVGMLAGEDGIGGIQFDNTELAFLVGNAALAVILLDGGLRTKTQTFRTALWPSATLATLGVLVTAGSVGLVAGWLLGIPWAYALLLGAVIGSTDAAAVFSVLRNSGIRLNDRVGGTLEIESGANDPMAILLVIVLVQWIAGEAAASSPWSALLLLIEQFAVGGAAGVGAAYLLSRLFKKLDLNSGLSGILLIASGMTVFAGTNLIGGSGFLAIYILGLRIGNSPVRPPESVYQVIDGLAWLSQASMFLLLGLLITPSQAIQQWHLSLTIALYLIFLARPLAVHLCLIPFRFNWRERLFISWVGLRGAVPIVLSLYPIMAGVSDSGVIFEITFAVVLISLLVQGATVAPVARLLDVEIPGVPEPTNRHYLTGHASNGLEIVEFRVEPESRVRSPMFDPAQQWRSYPQWVALIRGTQWIPVQRKPQLNDDDRVWLLLRSEDVEDAAQAFGGQAKDSPLSASNFFGEFNINPQALAKDLGQSYGVPVESDSSIAEIMTERLGKHPVVGDRIQIGPLRLSIRQMDGDTITLVGLKFIQPKAAAN